MYSLGKGNLRKLIQTLTLTWSEGDALKGCSKSLTNTLVKGQNASFMRKGQRSWNTRFLTSLNINVMICLCLCEWVVSCGPGRRPNCLNDA